MGDINRGLNKVHGGKRAKGVPEKLRGIFPPQVTFHEILENKGIHDWI